MYNNIALLLGHLVGDYLLQNDKMALRKSEKTEYGHIICWFHCFIYSACVAIFVTLGGWRFYKFPYWTNSCVIVFTIALITHFPFDRYSFGWTWMKWIGQSQFNNDFTDKRNYFVPIVYVAVDNTIHLVLMWILLSLLGK